MLPALDQELGFVCPSGAWPAQDPMTPSAERSRPVASMADGEQSTDVTHRMRGAIYSTLFNFPGSQICRSHLESSRASVMSSSGRPRPIWGVSTFHGAELFLVEMMLPGTCESAFGGASPGLLSCTLLSESSFFSASVDKGRVGLLQKLMAMFDPRRSVEIGAG